MQPNSNVVVSFPVDVGNNVKTFKDTKLWEQLSLVAFMQRHWADNQVSCTVSFKKSSEGNLISSALNYFQYQLKGISFLPISDEVSPYPQMPYEEITEKQYEEMMSKIDFSMKKYDHHLFQNQESKYCDSESCNNNI